MNLINDKPQLNRFISLLPQGNYYILILSRRKWYAALEWSNLPIIKHFTTKDNIIPYLENLEKSNCFFTKKGVLIPMESIGIYISMNPLNYKKGCKIAVEKLIRGLDDFKSSEDKEFIKLFFSSLVDNKDFLITDPLLFLRGFNSTQVANRQISPSIKTTIQSVLCVNTHKRFIDIDVDGICDGYKNNIESAINLIKGVTGEAHSIIETRTGFHFILDIKSQKSAKWINDLKMMNDSFFKLGFKIDKCNYDNRVTPLVGCMQGDFVPILLNI